MAYGGFKDLARRTAFDKILHDKAFNIARNPKFDRYHRDLASMVVIFFVKKTSGGGIKHENMSEQQLVEELHKPNGNKFKKRKVQSPFIENILDTGLAPMQLIINLIKDLDFYCV